MLSKLKVKLNKKKKFSKKDQFKKKVQNLEDQKLLKKVIKGRKNKNKRHYLVYFKNNQKKSKKLAI